MLEKLICNQRILEFAPTCEDVTVTTKVIFLQHCNNYFHPFRRKNIQPTNRKRPNSHVKRQLKSYPLNPRKSKYICAKRPPSLFDFVAISYSHVTIQFWSGRIDQKSIKPSLLLRRFVFRMAEASAKRVTGDDRQGTMGRVQTAGETPARSCVVFLAKKSFSWHGPFLVFLSLGSEQF